MTDPLVFDTDFDGWQIRLAPGPNARQVACGWNIEANPRSRGHDCLTVSLATPDGSVELGTIVVYAGGQSEVAAGLPLRVLADPRASILWIEFEQLFAVSDGVLSVEP